MRRLWRVIYLKTNLIMSQSFNFARFGRLFRKHTAEHFRTYLMATGVLLGGIALVVGFVAYVTPFALPPDMQGILFVMGLLATGAFFSSTVFDFFGERKQATAALMLPASHWEKYLVGWLYAVPIFLVVYIGCFYLVDVLVLQIEGNFGPQAPLVPLFSNESHLYLALPAYAAVSAVFLWGSIFFVKQQFIRTAFGLFVGGLVVSLVNFQLVRMLMGRAVNSVPYAGMNFQEGGQWHSVNLPPTQNSWFMLVPLGIMLLAWAAAYARVTEKQI